MVEHDGDDGECADAVEGGDIARAAFRAGRKAACGRLLGARRGTARGPLLGAAHGEARLLLLTHKVTSHIFKADDGVRSKRLILYSLLRIHGAMVFEPIERTLRMALC